MATEHANIADPYIHEPKGAAAASAGKIYVADGAGSGSFKNNIHTMHGDVIITGNTTATATTAAGDATLATDSDYVKITAGWSSAHLTGITFNTDELVFPIVGDYHISFWADIKSPTTNNFIGVKYAVNDTTPYSTRKIICQSNSTNDILNVSGMGIITTTGVNDTLSMYIASTKTDNLVVQEAGMVAFLIDSV